MRFFPPELLPPSLSPPHPCYPSSSLGSQAYLSSSRSAILQSCQKLFLSQSFISLECELLPSPAGCLLSSHSSPQASPPLPILVTPYCLLLPTALQERGREHMQEEKLLIGRPKARHRGSKESDWHWGR